MFFPALQDSSASSGSEPDDFLFLSLSHRWAAIFVSTNCFPQLARFLHDLGSGGSCRIEPLLRGAIGKSQAELAGATVLCLAGCCWLTTSWLEGEGLIHLLACH